MTIKKKLAISFLSILAIIIIAGSIGIIEIIRLHTVSQEISMKSYPMNEAILEFQVSVVEAHLWFEEIVTGAEEKEAITYVWKLLDKSRWYIEALLNGGENEHNTFSAIKDTAIAEKLHLIQTELATFRNLAQVRFDNNFNVLQKQEDQLLDAQFDALFKEFMNHSKAIEEMLHFKIAKDVQYAEDLAQESTLILILTTLLAFLVASFAFYYIVRDIMTQVGGEPSDIATITKKIAAGNLDITFDSRKATGIYAAVQIMVEHLKTKDSEIDKQMAEIGEQDWLRNGQAELNKKMRGGLDIVTLANNVISFLTTYLKADIGIFYGVKEGAYLEVIASYGYTKNQKTPIQFEIGEGLVGQAALKKETLLRTHTDNEIVPIIQSCIAVASPRHVLIIPFLYENMTVKGVIELGFSNDAPTPLEHEYLKQIMPSIGIAVSTGEARTDMEFLLQETQQKSEELQSSSEELQSQQEELRQINEELEERTRELEGQQKEIENKNRTLERTQVDMEKAKAAIEVKAEELELASQYKSEFLANMSHELRTPLNSMLMLSQILSENSHLNEKEVEQAQTIHNAGSDLLRLINEILDLSKIEAGKMDIQLEDMDIAHFIVHVKQKFNPLAEDKGLDFPITIADNVPALLYTDEQRFQQIINNLLSNAFKFTSIGSIKMLIQLTDSQHIAISVTDSGIGIPADKQQGIFEAFQQADGSTSRKFGGTGLGLSISGRLAELLGGNLELTSEEDKGSTFTLNLPILKSQEITLPSPKINTTITDDKDNIKPNDQVLLIIEDDTTFAKLLIILARKKNFKTIVAETGEIGLELAQEYLPHVIVLDIGLPEMDGWSVMEHLKTNPKTRHIPVQFISAQGDALTALKMGAVGYLHKPVLPDQIVTVFDEITQFMSKAVKTVLLLVEQDVYKQQIVDLIGDNIQTIQAITRVEALKHLELTEFDCIIIDVNVEDNSGLKLLEPLYNDDKLSKIPVILYMDRELNASEDVLLQQSIEVLTIKTVRSPEGLLNETTLFLHQESAKLSQEKQDILRNLHDQNRVLQGKNILIVDDDPRNSFALTTVLEDKEMEIFIASDGKEALTALDESPEIDLVIMDIMMPEMDGYEAMQKIRAQSRFRNLPIIALTAKAMKEDKAKCIDAGANDYLAKPVDTEKLLSLMRVWLYK